MLPATSTGSSLTLHKQSVYDLWQTKRPGGRFVFQLFSLPIRVIPQKLHTCLLSGLVKQAAAPGTNFHATAKTCCKQTANQNISCRYFHNHEFKHAHIIKQHKQISKLCGEWCQCCSNLKKITVIDDKYLHSTKLGWFLTLSSCQFFNCSILRLP